MKETKRSRQLVNRMNGYTGSYMPLERAQSIGRKKGITDPLQIPEIRHADMLTKTPLK
jgi:hypothetical protein